jgi:hypothetical protein
LISDCDSFFITISEPRKRKVFAVQEKMDILAQVDANKETHIALAARLGTSVNTEHYC